MTTRICKSCNSKVGVLKDFFASKTFPARCNSCGTRMFRRHYGSGSLALLGGGVGLFFFLFLFMSIGFKSAIAILFGYLFLVFISYSVENLLFDLERYTKEDELYVFRGSRNNIIIIMLILCFGAAFYFLDL